MDRPNSDPSSRPFYRRLPQRGGALQQVGIGQEPQQGRGKVASGRNEGTMRDGGMERDVPAGDDWDDWDDFGPTAVVM